MAKNKTTSIENYGMCKFCFQQVLIDTDKELTEEERNELATEQCTCKEAINERNRKLALKAVQEWIEHRFKESVLQEAMRATVQAIEEKQLNKASMKIGKYKFEIQKNTENEIVIKTLYKDEEEEYF